MTRPNIFNIADLIQARLEFVREARALPPGPERNQKRQIALSLKTLIKTNRERHDAFAGDTIH